MPFTYFYIGIVLGASLAGQRVIAKNVAGFRYRRLAGHKRMADQAALSLRVICEKLQILPYFGLFACYCATAGWIFEQAGE